MEELMINSKETEIFLINLRLCVMFIISVTLYFVAYKMAKKPKTQKKRESCEGLISPILAEILVDGKIDFKNLIMTTIVELQIKGNIEVINDNCIRLVHKDNLDIPEFIIVNEIFGYESMVNIKDINNKFTPSKYDVSGFIEGVSKICAEIQTRLYKMKLFSAKKMVILNIVSYIAMLILINLPTILLGAKLTNKYFALIYISAIISFIVSCIYFSRFSGGATVVDVISYDATEKGIVVGKIALVGIIFLLATTVFSVIDCNLLYIFEILMIYLINFATFKMSKNNVLSSEGLKERQKILELKNYLDNYNLVKTDGIENYIEWNKYFAYSVAFGIPNPVTTEIYKNWNNLSIALGFTKNLI